MDPGPKASRVLLVALVGASALAVIVVAPVVLHVPVAADASTATKDPPEATHRAPLPPPPVPRCGDGKISEAQAREMILGCAVEVLFQPHEGPVAVQLRDGRSYCADQRALDALPRLAISSCPSSPPVVMME